MIRPLEMVISGILLHVLSLFPNIPEWDFHDVIYMFNTDSIFTLNNINVDEIYFWYFLEVIVKDSVKLLH